MLKTTSELVKYLQLDSSSRDIDYLKPLINSILKCGDKSDADTILLHYLENPFEFDYLYLLPIFKRFGDRHFAEQIYNVFQENLKENSEILELLGDLKYEPIKPILAEFVFKSPESDYYLSRYSVLGLLNFNCDEYQNSIETAIEKCYGKNLFPEFVPALVCKLKDRKSILEKLYELGNKFASTDCIGGIILGFSLCGEEGREYFKQTIFNPNWEIGYSGTGSTVCTYLGLKNLGITFRELYEDINQISDKEKLMYSLIVFFALLEKKINDFEISRNETFTDIHKFLFQNTIGNLLNLAERTNKLREAYEMQKLIELKINEEAILKNYL
ncbi:hypothetical protein ACWA1C_20130 [Flectobacillus roseus]